MAENKNIPQFVACGLEMGNCGYQIPYDMVEHDKQIRAAAIDEVSRAMYRQCFLCNNREDMQKWDNGNWIRYKLFENVIEQLKENKK